MDLQTLVHRAVRFARGDGWMYQSPWYYDRIIARRFGSTRTHAYRHFLAGVDGLDGPRTCVDVACGTGITSIWMARTLPELRVIGVDDNAGMLALAAQRAERHGVADRCTFLNVDATVVTAADLPVSRVDIVTCSLGYSVIPNWQTAFRRTLDLLADDGVYAIFDQYEEDLRVPDFASDQTRKSWHLIENNFIQSDTEWFGNRFISYGKGKRRPQAQS